MQKNGGAGSNVCVSDHFANTFLEAQKLRVTKSGDKKEKCGSRGKPGPPPLSSSYSTVVKPQHSFVTSTSISNISDNTSSVKEHQAKYGSDRYRTRTYHLQNVASDSQPSIPSSVSDHSSVSRHSEPVIKLVSSSQLDKLRGSTLPPKQPAQDMDDGRGKSLGKNQSLAHPAGKRKNLFHKDIRRTQSEAQMNKGKSNKPNGSSFGSLKRALSPFIFGKKKTVKKEEESMTSEVMKKITDRDSVHSIPIVMETGFPAKVRSGINREQENAIMNGSACVRGLVSPLVHPRHTNNLASVTRGSLQGSPSSVRSESKLTRKRAILSQNGSPCISAKTSQSNSPAPSLDSVRMKNVQRDSWKLSTPTKDFSEVCDSGTPSVERVRVTGKSSTPSDKRTSVTKTPDAPIHADPLTVNFSGDISHAKKTLVKPKAIKAYQNPVFTPMKRCCECNSPISPDKPNKISVSVRKPTNGEDLKVPNDVSVKPNITVESPVEDLDATLIDESEKATETRSEMQDLLKRYSPPKQGNYGGGTLQRKLKEIKKELEDYKYTTQDSQKIGEIKDKRNSDVLRLHTNKYSDEVFYKTDDEMFNTTFVKPAEDDYYKEIEVRINPEGIAVVRRRHQFLPESDRSKEVYMRRSTIHVDDRVYCDKAVLQSIYGHSPTHMRNKKLNLSVSESGPDKQLDPGMKGMKLRSFIHQKSVPNLHDNINYSDSEDSFTETKNTLVSSERCVETARLKREYHRSNVTNLPIHKKYIRAYTKFYEQKLALKLLDLNRFIKEEKEQRIVLDQRIKLSLLENEELMRELNTAKQDILNMIEVIETPV